MSFEINIISVAQEKPTPNAHLSSIILRDEISHEDVARYYNIWPVFSNIKGIFYNIVIDEGDGFYSSFPICDADFDSKEPLFGLPRFADNVAENFTPLVIKDEYIDELINAVSFLIDSSPKKTILFLSRYEGGDYEVIIGTLTKGDFIQRLLSRKLSFNVCYVVADTIT